LVYEYTIAASIILLSYVLIQGRKGFFFFKMRFPWWKNKAAFYVIRRKSGAYKIDYDKWRETVRLSKDSIPTNITKVHNRESDTGEPVIFIDEGVPQNIDPNQNRAPSEQDKWYNQNIELAHLAGMLKSKNLLEQKNIWFLLLGIGIIVLIVGFIFLAFQVATLNDNLVLIKGDIDTYKPLLEKAIQDLNRTGSRIV
jgi:hypothetical protein